MGDVAVELEKARNALQAAERLNRDGLCDDAASRLYYAAYHAARASVWKERPDADPQTHKGVIILYAREVVRRGKAPEGFAALLAGLQQERERADYSGATVSRDAVQSRVEEVRRMVKHAQGF